MSSEKEDNSGKSDKHEKGSVISRCLAFIFGRYPPESPRAAEAETLQEPGNTSLLNRLT